uniref:Bax inhibitor-1 n=1 Tax=Chromera velia CCMP2878 TaxID=1169474 RepID=A0A0G4FJP7_9ALVE|eukprot:Cvel_17388.t1-p1 / transcript=Cvel_17388.t1 / gene=Cvel_17388 / organism=Chromera_velia_CCMP2878 / gene_product=Bax inhibitor 1, putative / transcript_product=Bax inhibitor 1, putative / location=Cvel_scaffold1384:9147-10061(+) / protein_length=229 / sequence_SO=supercontig / SO=protein_coding / is_pseudo=false
MTPLEPRIQKHLAKVYTFLTAGILVTSFGVWTQINVFSIPPFLSLIATIGTMWSVMSRTSTDPKEVVKPYRLGMALLFFFFKGAAMGNYIDVVTRFHPGILPTAFFSTLAVFLSFSAAALLAKRREYMFLGGLLGTALSMMSLFSLANMFFWSRGLNDALLYVGVFVFAGYIIFDTQVIVEQSANGQVDFVRQAIQLYVNLVALFIRILAILAKNQQKRSSNDKRRRGE